MPSYRRTANAVTPPAAAPGSLHANIGSALRWSSPPSLPYAPTVDCDPVDIINTIYPPLPVGTEVTTARGQAAVLATDRHA